MFGHVCKERNLRIYLVIKSLFTATEQDIRLDTDLARFIYAMLRGLCFQLTGGFDIWHIGEQHIQGVFITEIEAQLTHSLKEGQAFDVANRASDLDYYYIFIFSQSCDPAFDFVCDVGDNLNGLALIYPLTLVGQHAFIDLTGTTTAFAGESFIHKAFIVSQIKVCLGTVISDKNLSMLEGAHISRVHIQIWIQLLQYHPIAH